MNSLYTNPLLFLPRIATCYLLYIGPPLAASSFSTLHNWHTIVRMELESRICRFVLVTNRLTSPYEIHIDVTFPCPAQHQQSQQLPLPRSTFETNFPNEKIPTNFISSSQLFKTLFDYTRNTDHRKGIEKKKKI